MAHIVTCTVCKQKFDLETVQGVVTGRYRYAHQTCAPHITELYPLKPQRIKNTVIAGDKREVIAQKTDRQNCLDYIQKLFGADKCNWGRLCGQISNWIKTYHFTYYGIHNCLIYYYEIEKHPVLEWQSSLGIVPYIYNDVKKFYEMKELSEVYNQNKFYDDMYQQEQKMTISAPSVKKKSEWLKVDIE